MNTKILSDKALSVIDQYKNFQIGSAVCSIPYYNNKTGGLRGALKAEVGKGSPKDIYDEVKNIIEIEKIDQKSLNSENLKRLLVENNIGIDCSGFAYYVLNAEGKGEGKGSLDRHIKFMYAKNFIIWIRAKMMPEKNIDVLTFAHDKNSKKVEMKDIQPGDIITMINDVERNHILVINQVEYQNGIPTTMHYVHTVAWPTDGEYGHGIHEGKIEVIYPEKSLLDQRWIEDGKDGVENYTSERAKKSITELRRLNWF